MEKRVVITGLGAVTPVGIGKENFYNALLAGQSGIGPITRFDASEYATRIAGEVKDFDVTNYGVDKKEARRMDRSVELAIGAAVLACEDADLDLDKQDLDRCGTVVGTGIGGIDSIHEVYETLFEKGPGRVSPFAVPMMIANMTSARVSIRLGLKGPVITDVTACTSGTNAIGDAFRIIQRGDADIMFAGGTEAAVSPAAVAGFAAMKAMSTRNDEPTKASRPFDRDRDGFVMGEGSGIVVLEELEHAKARGAHIYAEVVGYGTNGDATTLLHQLQVVYKLVNVWNWQLKMRVSILKTLTTSMLMVHLLALMIKMKHWLLKNYSAIMLKTLLLTLQNP